MKVSRISAPLKRFRDIPELQTRDMLADFCCRKDEYTAEFAATAEIFEAKHRNPKKQTFGFSLRPLRSRR
uniref:Uncharacterized protein n=1 Tax=uncultured Chloroflexota bacterium TaxID=166587 RepID=H5SPI4_9CHLR|nr:hypothetical protein HGMM_F54B02C35 [uncultured Chloroflexota bacterium]